MEKGEELLVAQRYRPPTLMGVEAPSLAEDMVKIKFANHARYAVIGDLLFAARRRERLPQRAWRQIRLLREKENVAGAWANDAPLANSPIASRRAE